MLETQREPVPRDDEGELATARAFLDFARRCLLKKVEGLDEEQLRAESDRHLDAAGSPEDRTVVPVDGVPKTLRWVLAHKVSEVIRHVGHADILREQIDGSTGR